jgi:hypothetical protein
VLFWRIGSLKEKGRRNIKEGKKKRRMKGKKINHLNADLNSICHLLALLGAHHILHVSRIRVKKEESEER